ncbi:type I-E CRISPR-associated protein Cas6/Cse3/CasE [Lactobacillus nasalidis]|uniref:Type I-E CRISPR-associated protein Cas6/Cse3/CasE n=1 Tax=Lactobacillus nasalidis TaxID=2797258 RepID=A0ABQ3W8F2_9LACO|nr:type I-E CRISPR-associated protein Cas6/Cse3/CasE [Lactobacillus nasalidis]GHV97776.1 type I-E CRISPR-associated protein Cas6/Cse3/CasE [Lactobacillus nasalidis]GHV99095.1 type I-E CRISPR-associated protein Cas6/Cse3/CasE [Lactobacillus nasalidis]GHW01635.1 type I-E CRISPR-associated protein Cas6/Cse3/CasE [Lactobacillus nasalidis]
MYLSRVEVDSKNRQKIKNLSHLGAYHNWVERSFPQEISSGERLRHLWRLDTLNGKHYLLVLSPEKPNLQELERYGKPGTAICKDYEPFLNRLQEGQLLQFKLTANPVRRGGKSSSHPGSIIPCFAIDAQMKWLQDKAKLNGFELVSADVAGHDRPLLRKQKHVSLNRTVFEGKLKISNLDQFKNALTAGIGREKAFGMGLMTVIPVD